MAQEIRAIVRIGDTDLDGNKTVAYALAKIRGIGIATAYAICRKLGIDPHATLGLLPEDQINKLDWAVRNLHELAPAWFLNRRKDPETGRDLHLIGSELVLAAKRDVDLMKKLKSWKGIRHSLGLKVRGQRTVTTGRFGATAGVTKKKAAPGGK
ncbi:30S ribosomal protein S13 [Pyrobaculum calidifontis]|uniref:Small ribosomal subunit protein uS13 n=1 Tax=Pyrobaculum calidifontis (strain DSM 21063 / JCM 11548 / VA1) TaxID=410359 RepID=RS13_PYRCJ|nr:30S ribosomal protein S13 [Pyrobaculum calidifontis]A3MUT0.1 RecName: Full=Small ribosomal subunit protein uS13; AltName: Full=30S ribosomal protein S13 [Pyrobaculum calidifontis JCM 11548]ABO08397.1 SSU ribosomal protein S13P [Pyrobaculum calidifontis JCM 11548]